MTILRSSVIDRFGRLFLVFFLALAAVGGHALMQPASAQDSANVSFAFWGDPAEEAAYQEVVNGFEELYPDIDIDLIYTASRGDYQTKLATSFAGGAPPDVFLINFRRFGQFAGRGALEPLEPYLDASEEISVEDFYEVPIDAFRYRGGDLYCIPQNISSQVVYFNADLFEEFGIPSPVDGWSIEEFVEAAEALTQDFDGDGHVDLHGLAVDPSITRYAPYIWGFGGEMVDDVDNPTTLTLDTPEALAGINWFISLGQTGHRVTPSEAEALAEDDTSRFMNQRAAMLIQSRRAVPTLREVEDFAWDVAPLPVAETPANLLHSDAFCMAADAEDKEAAWTFIEYATGPVGQEILARTGRTVPSMISVAESDAFLKGTTVGDQIGAESLSLSPTNSQVYLDNIDILHRMPSTSTWPEIEEAFDTPFKRAFYVEIDVDGAIEVATFTSRDAFERALEEDQLE